MSECVRVEKVGDSGSLYRGLKKLGLRDVTTAKKDTKLTTEKFREHFKKVSNDRFENDPAEIERAVERCEDLRGTEESKWWSENLNGPPGKPEILAQMAKMRDSSPGEDGVRLSYLLKGGEKVVDEVVRIVQFMFVEPVEKWEDCLRSGVVVPLYKMKGDRDDPGNYRGVCLLSMGSRILARIVANRLAVWAEARGLLDDDQQGFRKKRATTDATQMMWQIKEDVVDLERRREGEVVDDKERLAGRLLDLKKAYPRVSKPALWGILERYGLDGNFLESIKTLHECTEYKIRGKMAYSEPWVPDRGLREGCPSSPILFNIYHQVVMRVAAIERRRRAGEVGLVAGVVVRWVPGSAFPSEKTWEKKNLEAVDVVVDKSLFADDTTILGNMEELEEGVKTTKEVMGWYEERNNDGKEEELVFGDEESGKIRMLGSWMNWKEDLSERLKRGGKAWWKTRQRLKDARISRLMQAKIVEASVESSMLFDCQARTWKVAEMQKMQSLVDRAYRYV